MVVCQSYYKVIGFFSLLKDQNLTTWNICALAFPEHACVEQHFHVSLPPSRSQVGKSAKCQHLQELPLWSGVNKSRKKVGEEWEQKTKQLG